MRARAAAMVRAKHKINKITIQVKMENDPKTKHRFFYISRWRRISRLWKQSALNANHCCDKILSLFALLKLCQIYLEYFSE